MPTLTLARGAGCWAPRRATQFPETPRRQRPPRREGTRKHRKNRNTSPKSPRPEPERRTGRHALPPAEMLVERGPQGHVAPRSSAPFLDDGAFLFYHPPAGGVLAPGRTPSEPAATARRDQNTKGANLRRRGRPLRPRRARHAWGGPTRGVADLSVRGRVPAARGRPPSTDTRGASRIAGRHGPPNDMTGCHIRIGPIIPGLRQFEETSDRADNLRRGCPPGSGPRWRALGEAKWVRSSLLPGARPICPPRSRGLSRPFRGDGGEGCCFCRPRARAGAATNTPLAQTAPWAAGGDYSPWPRLRAAGIGGWRAYRCAPQRQREP